MAILLMREKLALETRLKSGIDNELNRNAIPAGFEFQVEAYKTQYPHACHRPVEPCWTYNCHGLTFGTRRTWIKDPAEVAKILTEDDYQEIAVQDVIVGDIAVYYSDGDATHSGNVVGQSAAGPRILSKWAFLHEVVHSVTECPYDAGNVVYYRMTK